MDLLMLDGTFEGVGRPNAHAGGDTSIRMRARLPTAAADRRTAGATTSFFPLCGGNTGRMTTKAELQGLCIDATEAFLRTHAIEQALRERELVDQRVVTGIEVGADVSFRTRCGVEVDSETGGLTVESRSNSADFAVWFTMGRTYGEIAGDATGPDRPDSKVPPVKIPLLVTAMVGEEYTQYHPISTGEMEFDEDGSPYVYRTNLPFLRHRLPTPLERQGQLLSAAPP
jgi:hypothetical protein